MIFGRRELGGFALAIMWCVVPDAAAASLTHGANAEIVQIVEPVDAPEASPSFRSAEFSARLRWFRDGRVSKAQVFVKHDRYRIEHLAGLKTGLGFAGVTIVRRDRRKVWYLYSERRLLLSVPMTDDDLLPVTVALEGEVHRTLVGDAYVGTVPARLFEVQAMRKDGTPERFYEWVDVERPVLLKLMSQDRDWWIEYEHVVLSSQPDYYFEPPLGYRKVIAQAHPK